MRQLIPIDTTDLPDIFDIQLPDGGTYTFRIDYNAYGDYYTCTIKDSDDTTLITQEPLLLGSLVGIAIPSAGLPRVDLRVMDESGNSTDAGAGNFGDDNLVQLYIDDVDPNGSDTDDPTEVPLGYDPDESDDDSEADF